GSNYSPEEKAQATDYAWQQFLQQANVFAARGGKFATVANQAIYKTPGLTDTVSALLQPLGKSALDKDYTDIAANGLAQGQSIGSPSIWPGIIGTAAGAAAPFIMSALTGGGGNTTVGDANSAGANGGLPAGVTVNADGNLVYSDGTLYTGQASTGGA